MDLTKLFRAQKKLDDHIVKKKGLEGQDLLDKKILSLQVELGELANNHRGFKFWSEDQEPRTKIFEDDCIYCVNGIDKLSLAFGPYRECSVCPQNPLLEEYVDCLHFIISIGNDLEIEQWDYGYCFNEDLIESNSVTEQFISIISNAGDLFYEVFHMNGLKGDKTVDEFELAFRVWKNYRILIGLFLSLSKMLGFTWEQIEQAYFDKNKINHERQESGY